MEHAAAPPPPPPRGIKYKNFWLAFRFKVAEKRLQPDKYEVKKSASSRPGPPRSPAGGKVELQDDVGGHRVAAKLRGLEFPSLRRLDSRISQQRVQATLRHCFSLNHVARCIHGYCDLHCRGSPKLTSEQGGNTREHLMRCYRRVRRGLWKRRFRLRTPVGRNTDRRRPGNRWLIQHGESSTLHRGRTGDCWRLINARRCSRGGAPVRHLFEFPEFRAGRRFAQGLGRRPFT